MGDSESTDALLKDFSFFMAQSLMDSHSHRRWTSDSSNQNLDPNILSSVSDVDLETKLWNFLVKNAFPNDNEYSAPPEAPYGTMDSYIAPDTESLALDVVPMEVHRSGVNTEVMVSHDAGCFGQCVAEDIVERTTEWVDETSLGSSTAVVISSNPEPIVMSDAQTYPESRSDTDIVSEALDEDIEMTEHYIRRIVRTHPGNRLPVQRSETVNGMPLTAFSDSAFGSTAPTPSPNLYTRSKLMSEPKTALPQKQSLVACARDLEFFEDIGHYHEPNYVHIEHQMPRTVAWLWREYPSAFVDPPPQWDVWSAIPVVFKDHVNQRYGPVEDNRFWVDSILGQIELLFPTSDVSVLYAVVRWVGWPDADVTFEPIEEVSDSWAWYDYVLGHPKFAQRGRPLRETIRRSNQSIHRSLTYSMSGLPPAPIAFLWYTPHNPSFDQIVAKFTSPEPPVRFDLRVGFFGPQQESVFTAVHTAFRVFFADCLAIGHRSVRIHNQIIGTPAGALSHVYWKRKGMSERFKSLFLGPPIGWQRRPSLSYGENIRRAISRGFKALSGAVQTLVFFVFSRPTAKAKTFEDAGETCHSVLLIIRQREGQHLREHYIYDPRPEFLSNGVPAVLREAKLRRFDRDQAFIRIFGRTARYDCVRQCVGLSLAIHDGQVDITPDTTLFEIGD